MPDAKQCPCVPTCIFFNDHMNNMPAMADIMKRKYCQGEWLDCARYRVFKALGKDSVPNDLFPGQDKRADDLIAK